MGVEVIEWEVLSQDLLSDHRGIHVRLGNDREGSEADRRREATRYSKRGADWEKFERSVRKSVEEGPQTEESEGQWWQEVCCKAAEGAFSIRRKRKNKEWWDDELRKARAKANKSRREAQGEREAGARERKMAQYRGERKNETVEALFDKYSPGNEIESDREEEEAGEVPEDGTEDPYFTARETREAVWAFGQDKAPGGDGFPTWALRRVLRIAGDRWVGILNGCLESGEFPEVWKRAEVIWLPKPSGGLRPISLLPVVGKVLDKLCVRRLSQHLERGRWLSERQFGFRKGMETTAAAERFVKELERIKKEGRHGLVVTLDITNAFNTVTHGGIERCLRAVKCPRNLREVVLDFLRERTMITGRVKKTVDRGCPQRSSVGPILWITAMEGWFAPMEEIGEEVCAQAYADDQVVIVKGASVKKIEETWTKVWTSSRK
ncbi:hypothetical protein Trydic_g8433 [Trypoxylus dichotomus]